MALAQTLFDNFNDNSIDTGKWTNFGSGQVVETGGQIDITTQAAANYFTLVAQTTYDLTGSYVLCQVKAIGNQSYLTRQTIMFAEIDSNNKVYFQVEQNTVYAVYVVAGVFNFPASVAWNATNTQWLRIREASGRTYWEYSATGLDGSWTVLHDRANPITLTAIKPGLQAGNYGAEAGNSTSSFDNFNAQGRVITTTALDNSGNNAIGSASLLNRNTISATALDNSGNNAYGSHVVESGDDTIVATGYDNSGNNAFGSATVTPGPVSIVAAGYDNSGNNAFGAPDVGVQAIVATGLDNSGNNDFGAPVVTPGTATISASGYDNSGNNAIGSASVLSGIFASGYDNSVNNAFGSATITPGAVSIVATALVNSHSMGTPSVLNANIIATTALDNSGNNAIGTVASVTRDNFPNTSWTPTSNPRGSWSGVSTPRGSWSQPTPSRGRWDLSDGT